MSVEYRRLREKELDIEIVGTSRSSFVEKPPYFGCPSSIGCESGIKKQVQN